MATTSLNQSGGKGNLGKFKDHENRICAAGLPTLQPGETVKENLEYYSLSDTVDALIGDAVIPSLVTKKVPQQYLKTRDMRNAGIFSEGSQLINPPVKTKFGTLVEDFKNTAYNSYWNKEVGKVPDPIPSLPQGFKIYDTTAGEKNKRPDNLYEIIMPLRPIPDKTPSSKEPGYQMNRNYCYFNRNNIFGHKTKSEPCGQLVKYCLSNDKSNLGLRVPMNEKQYHYQDTTIAKLGMPLAPNNNIYCVPEGFVFGKQESSDDNLPECLRTCEMSPMKDLLKHCLEHLNTLRKCLAKRFDGPFFNKFYLCLKYLDISKSGWLEKQVIYHQCSIRYIRFNPSLIEPLLQIWNSFRGSEIQYETFIRIINYREPPLELPKIQDVPCDYIDYRTSYGELGKNQEFSDKNTRAGIPSGRYFDRDYPVNSNGNCKADLYYLPEETDMRVCLCPSIFTLLGISHRDMYAKREPAAVRRLFQNAGEIFEDEKFYEIWEAAKKHHPKEWVCYETFRRSLNEYEKRKKQKGT